MGDCFMNEIDLALLRHKKRRFDCNKKEDNKISNEFSKILLSIILVLSSVIFIKLDDDNKEWFKGHVLESNFAFMKINEWYHQTFGDILPSFQENTVTAVSEISEGERERYLDGYKFKVLKNTPIKAISSGILVYMGEKEGYKNTFIMQGVDGVDIWYGNIDNTNYKLYDYVEEGEIIGESMDEYYTVVFEKDGKVISYEDYFEQI